MKKVNKLLIFLIIIAVQVLIISLTYSYFDVDFRGVENATTVGIGSGEVSITFTGGPDLVAGSSAQSTAPILTKMFSVTGRNTLSSVDYLNYSASIRVTENTFTTGAITYTLDASGANGYTADPQLTRKGIETGAGDVFLGNARFEGQTEARTHDYTLKIYFHPDDSDIVDNTGKEFKSHVVVGEAVLPFNNAPNLVTGLTPIKFNGFTEVTTTADDEEWYDYENKKWANAKTADGSYWVWIPRYAYKIASCYKLSDSQCQTEIGKDAGDIEIFFLEGKTNNSYKGPAASLTPVYSGNSQTNFIKHPAFTFGAEEVEGFWVAKFQMSGTDSKPQSLPDVKSFRKAIGTHFTNFKNMKNNVEYGWGSSQLDTHFLKNIEWGAVAYLSQSMYGANAEVYINNSEYFYTGCAGDTKSAGRFSGCQNEWNTQNGVKASTTHNITGVYDMSGIREEYVSSYLSTTPSSNLATYGQPLVDSYNLDGLKYVDVFDVAYSDEHYGHALHETRRWYDDWSGSFTDYSPFYIRGNNYNSSTRAGVFSYNSLNGGIGLDGHRGGRCSLIIN